IWRKHNHLFPAGYNLELSNLATVMSKKTDPQQEHWIVWQTSGQYHLIPKSAFTPLSRSSFRKTFAERENKV
ncbi:MAG: hypothetical protein AAFO94_17735, partial [Bacteroidota bacterium]